MQMKQLNAIKRSNKKAKDANENYRIKHIWVQTKQTRQTKTNKNKNQSKKYTNKHTDETDTKQHAFKHE